jgi:hypothetical protein
MNTHEAELAATVHFARETMKFEKGSLPTEEQLLNEVMEWKKRHRPPYDRREVATTIRNLASLGWIDVKPSESISNEVIADFTA